MRAGNEWAWCIAVVRVSYGGIDATDILGACSYKSEADFRQPGGYFDDMIGEAIESLAVQLQTCGDDLPRVTVTPKRGSAAARENR